MIIEKLFNKLLELSKQHDILNEKVIVRSLLPREAIGTVYSTDYAILRGKEIMVEAIFKGHRGQAFTPAPSSFDGTLKDILHLDLSDLQNRGVFIAVLNAVSSYLNIVDRTIHCKHGFPEKCGEKLAQYLMSLGIRRVGLIGYQPAILKWLVRYGFKVRVADADLDNIGMVKFGVIIEDAEKDEEIIKWCDISLVTGSVFANGTLDEILFKYREKCIIYGVTGAAPSKILGFKRWCISETS